jgi:SWI/SNF chromatin-remodeling complex subunit SWI1
MLPPNANPNFQLDSSSLNKQMIALQAVGQARAAQASIVPGANSDLFLGGITNQPQNQAPPPSLSERSMSQNAAARNIPFKERANNFILSLASSFAKRNQPLPPAITGIPTPNYDPNTSPFKDIEPGSEPGSFKLFGKDFHFFQLWSVVWQRGGMSNLGKDNGWQSILQTLDLPESARSSLVEIYKKILLPFEQMYRQNLMEKAQAMRQQQTAANSQLPPTSTNGMSTQRGPSMGPSQPPSTTPSSAPPTAMQNAPHQEGFSAILDGPTLDQDLLNLKRKLEQEEEGKRSRQKNRNS